MKTPPDQNPLQRLEYLLELVLDGSCTDEQRQEFSQLLDQNPQVVPDLTEEVFIHSLLAWQGEEDKARLGFAVEMELDELTPQDSASPPSSVAESSVANSERETELQLRRWPANRWALAVMILVAVGLLAINSLVSRSSPELSSLAKIVETEDVVWSDRNTATTENGEIVAGRLETVSGQVTLAFRSGPVVRLEGPASLMIESETLLHLDRGQATARVPKHLTGFTIQTPVVNVIDQGTEFGVATRRDGHTDVVVFDGEVDLQDRLSADAMPTRLVQGEGARVDRLGSLKRIMQISMSSGGTWWTNDYPVSSANVIQQVRDNIPPEDGSMYFCYQITHHGLREDTFAYADHPHQLNGISGEGLPVELVGADYVKTFNDYRYMPEFRMEVLLQQPANLYVLFDDRVPAPEWLQSEFTDTGLDVGLDEGPWPERDKALRPDLPPFENEVGAGKSIDNTLSVWHRICPDTTPVSLGSMGSTAGARAMYVVAATPLETRQVAQFRKQFPMGEKLASLSPSRYNARAEGRLNAVVLE